MSNAEIEDVLSSIRRLVTEDLRHQRPARLTLGPSGFREADGALVLTPAQRVAESIGAPQPHRPWMVGPDVLHIPVVPVRSRSQAEPQDADPASPPEGEALASLERTISELEAAVADIDGEFESDTGEFVATGENGDDLHRMFESAAEDPSDAAPQDNASQEVRVGDSMDASGDDTGVAGASDQAEAPPSGLVPEVADLVATAAEDPAGASAASGWEEDLDTALTDGVIAGEADVQSAVDVLSLPEPTDPEDMWLADIDGHEDDAPAEPSAADAPAHEADAEDPVSGDDVCEANVDAPGGAASLLAGTVTPRIHLTAARDDDRQSTDATEAENAAPPDDEGAPRGPRILRAVPPEATPADSSAEEESLFRESDEALVDADALRDLVAEIIRQELQGALGERITRNVRKLVRREINRVLESRSFE
jgi:hypothetical protein